MWRTLTAFQMSLEWEQSVWMRQRTHNFGSPHTLLTFMHSLVVTTMITLWSALRFQGRANIYLRQLNILLVFDCQCTLNMNRNLACYIFQIVLAILWQLTFVLYCVLESIVFCVHWKAWYLQRLICFCVAVLFIHTLGFQLKLSNMIFIIPRGSVKLYDDIYSSDMIVASPLSLNTVSDFDWVQVGWCYYDLMCVFVCLSDPMLVDMHLQTI